MKQTLSLSFALLALYAGAFAQEPAPCNLASLQGSYGVTITGTAPAPSILPGFFYSPGTPEQIVGIAIQTFDGKGGHTQIDNVKGALSGIVPDRPGRGTYSVNADCTGTFLVIRPDPLPPLTVRFVIVDSGKEFRAVVISPQANMTLAHGTKVR